MASQKHQHHLRVVSYNALSDCLHDEQNHHFSNDERLASLRRKLLEQIEKGAIISLQEVSKTWASQLAAMFEAKDYTFFCSRYGQLRNGYMGVAIAFSRLRYRLLDSFDERISHSNVIWDEEAAKQDRIWGPVMKRPNKAVGVRLQPREYRRNGESKDGSFCVFTYHMPCIFGSDEADSIMCAHAAMLCQAAQNFARDMKDPLVLCGDFNSKPDSSVYSLISGGQIHHEHCYPLYYSSSRRASPMWMSTPDTLKGAGGGSDRTWKPVGIGPMQSAYAVHFGREPELTNKKIDKLLFEDCLDYIWVSPAHFQIKDCCKLPSSMTCKQITCGFPYRDGSSWDEPSDHLLIWADLVVDLAATVIPDPAQQNWRDRLWSWLGGSAATDFENRDQLNQNNKSKNDDGKGSDDSESDNWLDNYKAQTYPLAAAAAAAAGGGGLTNTNRAQIVRAVRSQIEYYFSAKNLRTDDYLRSNMDSERFVSLDLVRNFRKIRDLHPTDEELDESIRTSSKLEFKGFRYDLGIFITHIRASLVSGGFSQNAKDGRKMSGIFSDVGGGDGGVASGRYGGGLANDASRRKETYPLAAAAAAAAGGGGLTSINRAQIVRAVRSQIEYYLSFENLRTNDYLKNHMEPRGHIPLNILRNFREISDLEPTSEELDEAIRGSSKLEMIESKGYLAPRVRARVVGGGLLVDGIGSSVNGDGSRRGGGLVLGESRKRSLASKGQHLFRDSSDEKQGPPPIHCMSLTPANGLKY